MLNIQIFRLSVAAIITIAFSELLIKGSALGWHQNVPGEVWLVAHGLAVALTVRNTAAPSAQLPRLYMTYFIIAKGRLLCKPAYPNLQTLNTTLGCCALEELTHARVVIHLSVACSQTSSLPQRARFSLASGLGSCRHSYRTRWTGSYTHAPSGRYSSTISSSPFCHSIKEPIGYVWCGYIAYDPLLDSITSCKGPREH